MPPLDFNEHSMLRGGACDEIDANAGTDGEFGGITLAKDERCGISYWKE
jgi:hypothetical protein